MFECNICGKQYENKYSFLGHCSTHKRILKKRNINHECKYCNKIHKSGQSLGRHIIMCPKNPETKIRKEIVSQKLNELNNNIAYKEKLSKSISSTIKKKIEEGTWHNSFSKSRTHEYKGIKLYGTWELNYAKWLDLNNINWSRPKEKFKYILNNIERNYTPDFYLIDEDCYIEIKGYETEKDREKWKQFTKKLKVLKGKDLKELGIIQNYKDV
jgi:hypothetical protein